VTAAGPQQIPGAVTESHAVRRLWRSGRRAVDAERVRALVRASRTGLDTKVLG